MDLRNALLALKENIMHTIQLAASQHQTPWIVLLGTFAKQVDADLVTLTEIEERIERFTDQLHGLHAHESPEMRFPSQPSIQDVPGNPAVERTNSSTKKQGMDAATRARQAFIQTCTNLGIRLLPEKRTNVVTLSGARIGLPFAREFPEKPDRWFLGVNKGSNSSMCPYRCIAFLCQGLDEKVLTFIVPHKPLQ
jgi:hypothetical protein